MKPRFQRVALPAALISLLLVGIFAGMVARFRAELRAELRRTIINRDAAVLHPVALRQLAQRDIGAVQPAELLAAVLESALQENMLAVAIFDAQGDTLRFAPESLLLPELPLDDYVRLLKLEPISRYHAAFPLDHYFSGVGGDPQNRVTPVLEVLLPLYGSDRKNALGFAQYYIDARRLASELALTDQRINRQTIATLGMGSVLILIVVLVAFLRLRHAQRAIDERNERLVRANFELTLSAKASALGQITSHLVHELQGPVAGLRAVLANRPGGEAAAGDWSVAADYTDRMQAMIHDAVSFLGEQTTPTSYELSGHELVEIVRKRNATTAARKGVVFDVIGGFDSVIDNHRGGILCLITSNLVQNSIEATQAGHTVAVIFRNGGANATITVSDEGPGIPEERRAHLFEAGRSGRNGGSGLGLAISQLLARQIGATLVLESTGPSGTVFRLTLPVHRG